MGINGLLQLLKPCYQQKRIHQYKGKIAAVDTYTWLHKIIKGPSGLALIKGGRDKFKFVRDIIRRVQKVRNCGVDLILVFDGGPLPRKKQQQEHRKKRRQQAFQKAKQLLDAGDEEGYQKMASSIDISPDMAYHLILQLKKNNIKFIVAPYQADAQLAYLCRTGFVDFIITEDSDLIAFGAPKILYKFDFSTLTGLQISLDQIKRVPGVPFSWFTHSMFLTSCILGGCDYLGQLAGVGIKKAHKIISRVINFKRFLEEQTENIPQDYEQNFMKAFLTFRYQRVYCPNRKMCVQVNQQNFGIPIEQLKQMDQSNTEWSQQILNAQILEYIRNYEGQLNFDFLGPKLDRNTIRLIAQGIINPVTYKKYQIDDLDSLKYNGPGVLIQNISIKPIIHKQKDRSKFEQQKNFMTNFLKNNSKKITLKPNYKPLSLSQQDQFECLSIDSMSEKSVSQDNRMKQSKNANDSKSRRLMFQNQSDSDEENQKSDLSEEQKLDKAPLNLDQFEFDFKKPEKFEKPEKPEKPEKQSRAIQFKFLKQPRTSFLSVHPLPSIDQTTQKSPLKPSIIDLQSTDEQIKITQQTTAGTQGTQGTQKQQDPFVKIANNIKPMFGIKFFTDPLGQK